ncbi:MAG: GNAT family N-acetyltransferase [Planctomycetes bacterium]|nr:GNAT family N-acetyltransferase [Planctomycetota bacterium]
MPRLRVQLSDLYDDEPAARALAAAAGAHGVYVVNALAAGEGDGFVLRADGAPRAVAWCGPRGNLVVVCESRYEAALTTALLDGIERERLVWRIVMGPTPVVDGLRDRLPGKPLVHRDQLYFCGDRTLAAALRGVAVRPAEAADRDGLVQATLLLNQSDLNIQPARVDRRWLRDTVDERIRDGVTWVAGPPAGIWCKLDIGSDGPAGRVIEGVFTFAERRGQGLAAALVAACLAVAPGQVTLHVSAQNHAAQRAYARAGMRPAGGCRLLLSG